jgi:methyl-accepting chemotaxis protein/hemerythrin
MTEKFVWTPEYSVGVEMIDEQHRGFFAIANGIIDLAGRGAMSQAEVLEHLGALGDYALYHLGTEEKYFDEFHYPEAPAHVAAHDMFRETIEKYLDDAQHPEDTDLVKLSEAAAKYAGEWLMKHIKIMDQRYVECFHQHGLK